MDRELYLPKSWTDDRQRCRAAKIPEERSFATKPELAGAMALGALASPLPIAWVTADAAYGQEWRFRRILEETAVGYVLAVPKFQQVPRAAPVTPRLALPSALQGLVSLGAFDARLARENFGPSERELMQQRIDELAASRAAVLQAVDTERRRIERDLHDGVQQRLVALAMLLGRARRGRTPEQADSLLEQAHRESQEVVTELREVAWRVYPTALDNLGLQEALAGVSERCSIPIRMDFTLSDPLPASVETAAYFVVSEAVTNAAKYSAATEILVSVRAYGPVLVVRVEDNGVGGADPAGSGLTGLHSRVGALDGRLHVHSPAGGPPRSPRSCRAHNAGRGLDPAARGAGPAPRRGGARGARLGG